MRRSSSRPRDQRWLDQIYWPVRRGGGDALHRSGRHRGSELQARLSSWRRTSGSARDGGRGRGRRRRLREEMEAEAVVDAFRRARRARSSRSGGPTAAQGVVTCSAVVEVEPRGEAWSRDDRDGDNQDEGVEENIHTIQTPALPATSRPAIGADGKPVPQAARAAPREGERPDFWFLLNEKPGDERDGAEGRLDRRRRRTRRRGAGGVPANAEARRPTRRTMPPPRRRASPSEAPP